jgi:hypothetical protein
LNDFVVILERAISFSFIIVEVVIEGLAKKVLEKIVRRCLQFAATIAKLDSYQTMKMVQTLYVCWIPASVLWIDLHMVSS